MGRPARRHASLDVEGRGDGREDRGGNGGPDHDEREDQPDVIGLPDRADCVLDEGPDRVTPPAAAQEILEPCAEVGATEQGPIGRPRAAVTASSTRMTARER
jgi:hypothetical protein